MTIQYLGQKEHLAGKQTPLNTSAETCCVLCSSFRGFSSRLQTCCCSGDEPPRSAQEVQRCTVKLNHHLFQCCRGLERCPYPFHRPKEWSLTAQMCLGFSRESCLPHSFLLLLHSPQNHKEKYLCVLLVLEAQPSEVFLCRLKQFS